MSSPHIQEHNGDVKCNLAGLRSCSPSNEAMAKSGDTGLHGVPAAPVAQISVLAEERSGTTENLSIPWDPSDKGDEERHDRPQTTDDGPIPRYRILWPHARGGLGQIHV